MPSNLASGQSSRFLCGCGVVGALLNRTHRLLSRRCPVSFAGVVFVFVGTREVRYECEKEC